MRIGNRFYCRWNPKLGDDLTKLYARILEIRAQRFPPPPPKVALTVTAIMGVAIGTFVLGTILRRRKRHGN